MRDGARGQRTSVVARCGSDERHNSTLEPTARCARVGSAPGSLGCADLALGDDPGSETYLSPFPPFPRDDRVFVAMSFHPSFDATLAERARSCRATCQGAREGARAVPRGPA